MNTPKAYNETGLLRASVKPLYRDFVFPELVLQPSPVRDTKAITRFPIELLSIYCIMMYGMIMELIPPVVVVK